MYPLERIFHGGLVDILQVLAARLYLGLVHGTIQCGGRGIYHPYLFQGVLSLQGLYRARRYLAPFCCNISSGD